MMTDVDVAGDEHIDVCVEDVLPVILERLRLRAPELQSIMNEGLAIAMTLTVLEQYMGRCT